MTVLRTQSRFAAREAKAKAARHYARQAREHIAEQALIMIVRGFDPLEAIAEAKPGQTYLCNDGSCISFGTAMIYPTDPGSAA